MRGLILVALSTVAFAQPDARDLVRKSIQNGAEAWRQSFDYYCLKDDVTHQLAGNGSVKAIDDDVYQVIPLGYGASYEEHIKHDNEPLPPDQQAKIKLELARLQAASPAEKRRIYEKAVRDRSYMKEVPDAFDFHIAGEENLPTGPAWVVKAVPHPGYEPRSRYAHMFSSMRGTLWIDKKDLQWVKADAVAMNTVAFGFFVARLAKGSHIVLEQKKLPSGAWVPADIQAKAGARIFVFWNRNFEETISYRQYRKANTLAAER